MCYIFLKLAGSKISNMTFLCPLSTLAYIVAVLATFLTISLSLEMIDLKSVFIYITSGLGNIRNQIFKCLYNNHYSFPRLTICLCSRRPPSPSLRLDLSMARATTDVGTDPRELWSAFLASCNFFLLALCSKGDLVDSGKEK